MTVGTATGSRERRRSCRTTTSPLPAITSIPASEKASGRRPKIAQPTTVAQTSWT